LFGGKFGIQKGGSWVAIHVRWSLGEIFQNAERCTRNPDRVT